MISSLARDLISDLGGAMFRVPRLVVRVGGKLAVLAGAILLAGCEIARVPIHDGESAELQSVDRLGPRFLDGAQLSPETPKAAICNIESIAGISGAELGANVSVALPLVISGWAYFAAGAETTNSVWLRFKTGESEKSRAIEHPIFQARDRPDVANVLNIPSALRSGFVLRLEALEPGEYVVEIVFDAGPERVVCAHSRRIRVVAQ